MSEPVVRFGVYADAHVGYAARCRVHPASGLNMRTRDGMLAVRAVTRSMIEAGVDFVVAGGDDFHRSHPAVGDIVWMRQQMESFAKARIPVYGNTGNHDASAERGKSPATAAINDPDRGIHYVTEPYRVFEVADGLVLHVISHYGLAQSERLLPEPVDGAVNVLSAHGAAMLPGHEVFRCVDSPGEVPIGLDLLADDRFALKALGHYHGMGEILPGVWYAGSLVRRGFSDPAGGRGWLLVEVHADGRVQVTPQFIAQRAQHDLPRIDARGLSGAQVEELIRQNLAGVEVADAIVRQVVLNCSTSVRQGIDQPALAKLTKDALVWMPDFRRPDVVEDDGERVVEGISTSMLTAGSADLPKAYGGWVPEWAGAVGLAEQLRPVVVAEGERHLREASQDVEIGGFADPDQAAAPPRPRAAGEAAGQPAPDGEAPEAEAPRVDATTGEETPW
ncbi:metallophosphoesterase family protein [Kineococcus sp. SYSU DK006]|uniref:metallophosphoesterase family protein n=1 Tax=Kineococcus sp. SYSU DK006 TaxID=3383127 RepID=UPI003D7E77B7